MGLCADLYALFSIFLTETAMPKNSNTSDISGEMPMKADRKAEKEKKKAEKKAKKLEKKMKKKAEKAKKKAAKKARESAKKAKKKLQDAMKQKSKAKSLEKKTKAKSTGMKSLKATVPSKGTATVAQVKRKSSPKQGHKVVAE